jgi:hypothetical protein
LDGATRLSVPLLVTVPLKVSRCDMISVLVVPGETERLLASVR